MRQMPFHQRNQHTSIDRQNIFTIIQGTEPDQGNLDGTVKRDAHVVKELSNQRTGGPITQPDSLRLIHAEHKVADAPGNIVMIWSVSFKLAEFNLAHHKVNFIKSGGHSIRKNLLGGVILDKLGELTQSCIEI